MLGKASEDLLELAVVKESPLYEKLRAGKARCLVCERRCVLGDGDYGFCGTRANIGGKVFTLVYGDLSALESRPIEIKPFFHYYPASSALTFSTWSCNFACPWCQNYHLSKVKPSPRTASYIPPEDVVREALRSGDQGVCVSFNEPTMLFEYSLDVFELAAKRGLYCCYVSNGYMTDLALKSLLESGLSGLKVDVKGTEEVYRKYCGVYGADKVWRNARLAKEAGAHVEVVYLVVNGVNDELSMVEEVVERHLKALGPEVPMHFTRYFPAYKFYNPPTPVEKLEQARNLAVEMGVKYAYIGNVPGHPYENTYCPSCGQLLIRRYSYSVLEYNVTSDNKCPRCGCRIPIYGRPRIGSRASC